jgi:integrase
MIYALNELSRSLARREDQGVDPTVLGRADITALLGRLGRLQTSGRLTAWQRRTTVARLAQFLREARDWGLGPGKALLGLPGDFAISRQDTRALKKRWQPEPGRALPPVVIGQLLDESALALMERLHGPTARAAIELLAATGRRPSEICELSWDCLAYDTDVSRSTARRRSCRCSSMTCRRSHAAAADCRSMQPRHRRSSPRSGGSLSASPPLDRGSGCCSRA